MDNLVNAVTHELYELQGNILTDAVIKLFVLRMKDYIEHQDPDFYAVLEASQHILEKGEE